MDRKRLIREYKDTPRPAGVYRVRNKANGKSLLGSGRDLPGILNRQRFQLQMGVHPDRELQKDWNDFGPDAFEFETLDQLGPSEEPGYDPTNDLRALTQMWWEKLSTSGVALYPHSSRGA